MTAVLLIILGAVVGASVTLFLVGAYSHELADSIAYTASARAKRIMEDHGVHPRKAEKIRELLEKDLLDELTHE